MTHALLSGAAAFAVALLAGRPFVQWIRGQRLGKAISEEGPSTHSIKAGTPTMGGLLIFGAVAIVTIPTNLVERLSILLPLGVVISGMIVGGIDDLGTLTERLQTRGGLSWRLKFLYQLLLSGVVAGVLYFALEVQSINVPWLGQHELGVFYIPIAVGTVIATTSAVSITTGWTGCWAGRRRSPSGPTASSPSSRGSSSSRTSPSPWPARCSDSSGSTPIRRPCSWATRERCRWARRSPRWR